MKYKVKGSNVTLELSAEEINEVIEALELCAPHSELLAAFRQFRKEEFAWASFEGRNETVRLERGQSFGMSPDIYQCLA